MFWMESRLSSGTPWRHFNKNYEAGSTIGLIIYADNTLSSNLVGGVEFEVEFPTNNVRFSGPSFLTPYIKNAYGLFSTNDFFYQAPLSWDNSAGLLTRRFALAGTQPSDLVNQSPPRKSPVAILNFGTYPDQQAGLCSFRIKNTKAYDLTGNEIPSVGTQMSLNVVTNIGYWYALQTNAAVFMDMNLILGKQIPCFFVEAYPPYISTPVSLKRTDDLSKPTSHWNIVRTSEYSQQYGACPMFDVVDWSAATNRQGFYRVTK